MDAIPVLITESNYHQLLNQCELLEIEHATNKEINIKEVYPIALASCILLNDLQTARHIRQRINSKTPKESTPEIEAIWKVVVDIIKKSYSQVYTDLDAFEWSQWMQPLITKIKENTRNYMLQLVSTIYTAIQLSQAAEYFGLSEADVLQELVVARGWEYNEATGILYPAKSAPVDRHTADSNQFAKLADIVLNLEKF
ncbi:COP9 signalosome [Mucor lusitanicus]|uniref:COP9 signalosome n=2 Tax=Mucor circinelloides f. lusitanicus TaxID=29924 RepID=A0A8H4BNH3_MUCCL|nr:COP9 signalosome [Mucor lusitanicus]